VVRALRAAASQDDAASGAAPAVDPVALLEAIGPALEEPRLDASALALTTTLAWHLGVDRVSLGEWVSAAPRVLAISDAPDRALQTAHTQRLEAAMAETAGRGEPVMFTGIAGDLEAHRRLAEHGGARCVYSVPIRHRGDICAVMVCERMSAHPMAQAVLRTCDALAAILGPALTMKRHERATGALR
jgi:hypothetical protein